MTTKNQAKLHYKTVEDILETELYTGMKTLLSDNTKLSLTDTVKLFCKKNNLNPENPMTVYNKFKQLCGKFDGVNITKYKDNSLDNNFLQLTKIYYQLGADAKNAATIVSGLTNLKKPHNFVIKNHLHGVERLNGSEFENSREVNEYLNYLINDLRLSRGEAATVVSTCFRKSLIKTYKNLDNKGLVKTDGNLDNSKLKVLDNVGVGDDNSPMLWVAWEPELDRTISNEVLTAINVAVDYINLGATLHNAYLLAKKVTGITNNFKSSLEDYVADNELSYTDFFTSELVYEYYQDLLRNGSVEGKAVLKVATFFRKNVLAVHKVLRYFKGKSSPTIIPELAIVKSELTEHKVEKLSDKDRGFMISEISYMLRQQSDLYLQAAYYKLAGINEKQSA